MKYMPLILMFSLLFLTACQETKTKKSSSSNTSALCSQGNNYNYYAGCPGFCQTYPTHTACATATTGGTTGTNCQGNYYYNYGCPGFCQSNPTHSSCSSGTTTGGSTGSTTNPLCYQGNNYYYLQGCPGFCQYYPTHASCSGGGGTTTPPTNSCPSCPTSNLGGWTGKYPGGVPAGSCSSAYTPAGVSYTPYETRKASMTIVGKTWYNPADSVAPNYMNTSAILKSVANARSFFSTDAILKVRFKVRPQPESSSASPYCYGRQSGSSIAGYHKLQFNVVLVGVKSNGQVETEPVPGSPFTIGVNSCTPSIDLSSYASAYPNGIYLRVESVRGNQQYIPNNYEQYGFRDMPGFTDIRSQDCWSLDVEVAADGTKTFD